MKYAKALAFAVIAGATIVTATGCAVIRGQETAGAYIDDTAITTSVKTKFVEDKTVDASAYLGGDAQWHGATVGLRQERRRESPGGEAGSQHQGCDGR